MDSPDINGVDVNNPVPQVAQVPIAVPIAPAQSAAPAPQPQAQPATGSFADKLGSALQTFSQHPATPALIDSPGGFSKMILSATMDALKPTPAPPQPSNGQRIVNSVENFFSPLAQFKNAGIGGAGAVAQYDQQQREAQRQQQIQEQQNMSKEQREKLQFAMNVASSNSAMLHSQFLLHKAQSDEINENSVSGQKQIETLKNQPQPGVVLGTDLTSDKVKQGIDKGSFNPSTGTAIQTGKVQDGEDENGNPRYRATYAWVELPKDVRITDRDEAKSLMPSLSDADLAHIDDGHPLVIPGDVYNGRYQAAETERAVKAAAQKASEEAAIATGERHEKLEAQKFDGDNVWANDLATIGRQHPNWSLPEQTIAAYRMLQANPPLDANGNKKFPNLENDVAALYGEKNFNQIQQAAETARHNRADEQIKRQQELAPSGGALGNIPISAGMQQKIDELRQVNPTGAAVLDRFDNLTKAALISTAFGDGSVDFDQAFPARLTKGAPGISRQSALGVIRQINPQWNEQQYRATTNAYKEATNGKNSQAVQQYNNFIQHSSEAVDALSETGRKGPRVWNMALNKLENAGYGTDAVRIQSSLSAVRGEISLLLSGGYKPSEDEQKTIHTILSDASTPSQLSAALQQYAEMGTVRLDNINENYKRVTGKNLPRIIDQKTLDAAKHLSVSPKAYGTLQGLDSSGTIFGNQSISGANQPQAQTQPAQQQSQKPTGATMLVPGSDGKMHWSDGKSDLGVAH